MTTTGREEQVGENLACVGESMSIDGETTVLIVISLDKIDRYKCRLSVTKDSELIYDEYIIEKDRAFPRYQEMQKFFLGKIIDNTEG